MKAAFSARDFRNIQTAFRLRPKQWANFEDALAFDEKTKQQQQQKTSHTHTHTLLVGLVATKKRLSSSRAKPTEGKWICAGVKWPVAI